MILCGIQLIEIEFIQIENCFLQMYGNICGNKREKNIEKYTQILSCSGGENWLVPILRHGLEMVDSVSLSAVKDWFLFFLRAP